MNMKFLIGTNLLGLAAVIFLAGGQNSSAVPVRGSTALDPGVKCQNKTCVQGKKADQPRLIQIGSKNREAQQEGVYRCCIQSIKGQPLKGVYCSTKQLDQAFRRGIVRIEKRAGGAPVCVPTGRSY